MSNVRRPGRRRVGGSPVRPHTWARGCEPLEARTLLCALHSMFFLDESTPLPEPQVFTPEQLAAAATLDAQHAAEVDAYLAAKAGGKLGAEGGIGALSLGNIVWTNRN